MILKVILKITLDDVFTSENELNDENEKENDLSKSG